MTLILALRFKDGLLLASDSQATAQASGQWTKQEIEKIFTLRDVIGWGASGSVGLTQRLKDKIEGDAGLPKVFSNSGDQEGAQRLFLIVNKLQKDAVNEFVSGVAPQGTPGSAPQMLACLFIGYARGQPFILEIAANGTRQFHTVPYAAVGSGDVFALHAIRSVAHYDILALSREQAAALAYRTIDNAINTAAFGLGGPVQLLVVNNGKASRLNKDEVEAVRDLVDLWKRKEVETLGSLSAVEPGMPAQVSAAAPTEQPPKE